MIAAVALVMLLFISSNSLTRVESQGVNCMDSCTTGCVNRDGKCLLYDLSFDPQHPYTCLRSKQVWVFKISKIKKTDPSLLVSKLIRIHYSDIKILKSNDLNTRLTSIRKHFF